MASADPHDADPNSLAELNPMDDMAQQMLEVLGRPTGIGIFSRSFVDPGKGRIRQWFSLASGLASLQYKVEYRTRFEEVPEWVLLCHPDHQIALCRVALGSNRPLPPDRPPAQAELAGRSSA